jgi:hypothetical protein
MVLWQAYAPATQVTKHYVQVLSTGAEVEALPWSSEPALAVGRRLVYEQQGAFSVKGAGNAQDQ